MNDESSMNTRSDTSCRFGSTDIKCRGGMRVSVIVIALAWIARSARSAVLKLDLRDARDRERWRDALAEVDVAAYAYSESGMRETPSVSVSFADETPTLTAVTAAGAFVALFVDADGRY